MSIWRIHTLYWQVVVICLRVNVNLKAITVEELIDRRKV
jgi:hypothetical protein